MFLINKNKVLVFILTIFIVLIFSAFSFAKTPAVYLTGKKGKIKLSNEIDVLLDKSIKLTINDVINNKNFKQNKQKTPSFGFDGYDYWVRFKLSNNEKVLTKRFLEIAYPHFDYFQLFLLSGNDLKKQTIIKKFKIVGDRVNFNLRKIKYEHFVFPLTFKKGESQYIYIHFWGKSFKKFPIVIWSSKSFSENKMRSSLFSGVFYGILLVMLFFNLFIFFFLFDINYLYYVLFIFFYALVQMSYDGLAFQYLWPNFPAWQNYSLPFLIFTAVIFALLFADRFLHFSEFYLSLNRISIFAIFIFIVFSFLSFLLPYIFSIKIAMVAMVFASIFIFVSAILIFRKGFKPASFFLLASIFFVVGMLLLALEKLSLIPSTFFTEYSIQIGSALEVILLSLALAYKINLTEKEKKRAVSERMKLQEKYRFLVEHSNDIIFTMDKDLNILAVNKVVKTYLSISPEKLVSKSFFDILYEDNDHEKVSRHVILEKFEILKETKQPVTMKVKLQSMLSSEPKDMNLRLEFLNIDGDYEIIGRASVQQVDSLLQYFIKEEQEYSIDNYLLVAEDMSNRITRNLEKFLKDDEVNLIKIALREIIINAIEHGNLGLSFDEKTEAMMNGTYFQLITQRKNDKKNLNKKVHLYYALDHNSVVYKIDDCGNGFDFQKYLSDDYSENQDLQTVPHGRGLIMARTVFDSIEFNEKGNSVQLKKNFKMS